MIESGTKVFTMSTEGLPVLDLIGVQPSTDPTLSTRSSTPYPRPDDTTPTKAWQKPMFSSTEDLVIVHEVSVAEAHVAVQVEDTKKFKMVAMKENANLSFLLAISGKYL